MVVGPKQALALEKMKNPEKLEATITGLMQQKNLTREQAEQRYGEFLVDPDGFALRAKDEEMKEAGYKDWIEMAVARSDDPDATRKRIEDFTDRKRTQGIIIMAVFSAAAVYQSVMNPYVAPGN